MYEESNGMKRAHKTHKSILYLNLQIKNFLSLSHSPYIHIKNILKKLRENCHHRYCCFYSHTHTQFQCFCSPDMMPAYLSEKELDRDEEKWKSEQVDRRNKKMKYNNTYIVYMYIYILKEKKSSTIRNITLARQKNKISLMRSDTVMLLLFLKHWKTWRMINF